MKAEREIVAAVLQLVAAQTNQPLDRVIEEYETILRRVYDLSGQLGDSLEHGLQVARSRRPTPRPPGPPAAAAGGRP